MFELRLLDLIEGLEKLNRYDLAVLIGLITVIWICFMIIKFALNCIFQYIKNRLFAKVRQTQNEFMLQSNTITNEIIGICKELRDKLCCDAVRVWQYSNGEMSINQIGFLYQVPKYESVKVGKPSILQENAKIPVQATPYITDHMFLQPEPVTIKFQLIDKIDPDTVPDVHIFKGFNIKTSILSAVQCHKMTAGFLAASWVYMDKPDAISDAEMKAVNEAAIRIGMLFEVLEDINKNKRLKKICKNGG